MAHQRSFILRALHDEPGTPQPCWRYVLIDAERDCRWGFTSLDQLFTTLSMEIGGNLLAENTAAEIVREVEALLRLGSTPDER